ncbi:SGNH/GDSL hydrolase family protein [Maribacter algicola]|uniref:SGNH/GDSL hydrolase family protein n=1 Tax=Meishania litoralis TaxID=3434685 RepID=A0ACC7LKN9_9FLAO
MGKLLFTILIFFSCSKSGDQMVSFEKPDNFEVERPTYSYLALGDSYTVGESVTSKSSFPKQLEKSLEASLRIKVQTQILAKTGWRTDNLLDAIETADLKTSYDFVTLLIGVNNQYQDIPFARYEKEFPELLSHAIKLANGNSAKVIVVSIPDWGFTPFGKNRDRQKISAEIDLYNSFAKKVAEDSQVHFINITDISREGLERPELVANDGLHPSKEAYKLFVERIGPIISPRLKD